MITKQLNSRMKSLKSLLLAGILTAGALGLESCANSANILQRTQPEIVQEYYTSFSAQIMENKSRILNKNEYFVPDNVMDSFIVTIVEDPESIWATRTPGGIYVNNNFLAPREKQKNFRKKLQELNYKENYT